MVCKDCGKIRSEDCICGGMIGNTQSTPNSDVADDCDDN